MPYYQNPMMPNYQQYPMMQNYQQPMITGKTVNSFSEITANDVPMTGGFAVFPKADMSEIEIRCWNANGTISTRAFKPVILDDSTNTHQGNQNGYTSLTDTFTAEILAKLENIERMMKNEHDRSLDKSDDEQT